MIDLLKFIRQEKHTIPKYNSFEGFVEDFPYSARNEIANWMYVNESTENITNDELWEAYINEQWNFSLLFDNERDDYVTFQNKLYETLNLNISPKKFAAELNRTFNLQKYEILNNKGIVFIRVHKRFDINNDKLLELLNRYNYFIAGVEENDFGKDIRFSQWHGKEITNKIYDEKFVYHITSKLHLDSILKFGLSPKGLLKDRERVSSRGYNQNSFFGVQHPQRIYFLNPNTPKEIINSLKEKIIRNGKRYADVENIPITAKQLSKEAVLLKIDLNKLSTKPKFFIDEDFGLNYAVWTSEPISPKAISIVEIDNESIFDKIKRIFLKR